MALQSSGVQISASDIRTEFGPSADSGAFGFPSANTAVSLGNYRVSKSYGGMTSMPLDQGVPQAGAIRFSDFYAKRLNIISDLWRPINNNTTRRNGRSQYNSGEVDVLGWRSKPSSSSGCKVFIHVNQTIGSASGSDDCICAVRTGSWDNDTRLETNVGSGGRIFGAGGRGGNGGIPGGVGSNGTSGLGVEYDPSAVVNNGYIQAGYGGGGGGGRSAVDPSDKNDYDPTAGGGGGGGGAGFPIGQGGSGGSGTFSGSNGNNSSQTTAGLGGAGGSGDGTDAGDGGRGGDPSAAPQRGGDGNESYGGAWETVGGNPGLSGDAVRIVTGTAGTPDVDSTETFTWTRTNTDQYPFVFFSKVGSDTGPSNFTIGIATGTSAGVGDIDANFRLTSGAFGPFSSGYPDPIEGQATNDSYVKLDLTGTGTATLNFAWTWNDQLGQDGRACDFVEVFLTSPTGGSVSSTYEKFTMTWNQETGSSNASVTVVKPNPGTHELTVKLTGTFHTFEEDEDGGYTDIGDDDITVDWLKWSPQSAWVKSSLGASGWYLTDPQGWSQFMKDYAMFPSNTQVLANQNHTGIWRFNLSSTGTYTLECQCDGTATFVWDTTTTLGTITSGPLPGPHNTSTNYTINVTDTRDYWVTATINNGSNGNNNWNMNPAGVAWVLKDATGGIVARSSDAFPQNPSGAWGSFMNTYAVFPSTTNPLLGTWHEADYVFAHNGGQLFLEVAADNEAQYLIDDTLVGSTSNSTTSDNITTSSQPVGNRKLTVKVRNNSSSSFPNTWPANPGGVAFVVKNASGAVLKTSLNTGDQPTPNREVGVWTDTPDEYDNQTDPNNPNSWTPGQLYNEDDEPEGLYKSQRYLHGILTGNPAGLANPKTLGIHDMDGDDNNAALTVSVVNTTTSGTGAMSGTVPATVAPGTVYVGQAGNSTGYSVNSTNPRQLTVQGQGTGSSSDDLVVNVTSGTFAEANTQISWTAPSTGQGTPSSGTTSGVSVTNNGTIAGDIEYGVTVC